MEKWKTKSRVFHFPTAPIPSLSNQKLQQRAGYRPRPSGAPRRLTRDIYKFGNILS
jgi:hypothetical protein